MKPTKISGFSLFVIPTKRIFGIFLRYWMHFIKAVFSFKSRFPKKFVFNYVKFPFLISFSPI
ncbi:hypothetical protein OENI_50140 [Oenococcus oeni]|nr:hypothetical protein OENI_50140 [Oenococcus oeni]